MAESQQSTQPQLSNGEDMTAHVMAMEAALLSCLPARELQAIDRSAHPSHQIDVERHARNFMDAAKKLHLYFLSLQQEERPTKPNLLRKEVAAMEEELKMKKQLVDKQERLVKRWKVELKNQLDTHNAELEKV